MPRLTVSIDINVAIDVEAVSSFRLFPYSTQRLPWMSPRHVRCPPTSYFIFCDIDMRPCLNKERGNIRQKMAGKALFKNGFSGSVVSVFTSYRWRTRPCYHLWSRALLDRYTGLFKSFYRPLASSGVWKNLNALIGKKKRKGDLSLAGLSFISSMEKSLWGGHDFWGFNVWMTFTFFGKKG